MIASLEEENARIPAFIKQRFAKESDVRWVMGRTGCSEAVAIAELVAEEGDAVFAVYRIRHGLN